MSPSASESAMTHRGYTVATIASAMARPVAAIQRRANHDSWPVASIERRRGQDTRLFAYPSLPTDVRQALDKLEASRRHERALDAVREMVAERRDQELAASIERKSGAERAKAESEVAARNRVLREGRLLFNALPPDSPKRRRALAREWCVLGASKFRREHGGSWMGAMFGFAEAINAGDVDVPPEVLAELPARNGRRVSEGSIRTWHAAYRVGGIWALTDQYGNREGAGKIESNRPLLQLVLGALQEWSSFTPRKCKDWLEAEHPDLNTISYGTIRRFFNKFKTDNPQLCTYLRNPDRWKNIYMVAPGKADQQIVRLNQRWEIDSTPGDWLLKDGRHTVIGCIDVYSRRLKLFVSKTSTAMAIKQLLRRSLLGWGVPEAIRTDNGKDYTSQQLDSLMYDLHILHEVCMPFASEEKPFIERAFRTMSHGIFELLPGFVGHSVADRKQIEARASFAARVMKEGEIIEAKLTACELQAKLDDWAEHLYAESPHAGLDGRTPREVARDWRDPINRIEDERALDELLAEIADTRTVSKKGIKFDNRVFVDERGDFGKHIGREVLIRLDEQDMGRIAVYSIGKTRDFLFWAVDIETLGIDRAEYAAAARAKQKKFMAAQAAELKQYGKLVSRDPVGAVLEYRKSLAQNVIDIQPVSNSYSTPALLEAARAAAARSEPGIAPVSRDEAPTAGAMTEAEVMDFEAWQRREREGQAPIYDIRSPDVDKRDPCALYAYWWWLDQRVQAGEQLNEHDAAHHAHFPNSTQFKTGKELLEEFEESPEERLPDWAMTKKKAG